MKKFFLVCAFVLLCPALVGAIEVPGIVPADFGGAGTVTEAHWLWTLLGSGVFASILAMLAKLVQSVISSIKDARISRACEFVWAGTMTCYQEYVRAVKERHADGKLTLEEKNEALQYAYRKAVEIARTEGLDLLKVLGKDMVFALIEKYVGESKAGALARALTPLSASHSAGAPLPDLPV